MKVLVTGGAGFIGREVVRQLLERGDKVLSPVRDATGARLVAELGSGVATPVASVDDQLTTRSLVERFQPEAAIHLAWYAKPTDYRTSAKNLVSLQSTIELTHLLLEQGCRKLVYAGTCFEYRVADGPRQETDPTDPRSLYAAAKLAAGAVTGALAEAGDAELAWARIYFPYGPGESPQRLLPLVARKLAAGEPVDLTSGTQVRDQVHVADVASGLIWLTRPGASGPYNLGSGVPVTLRETVQALADLMDRPDLLRFGVYPERTDEPASMYADMARLRGLGWEARYPEVRDGLRASLDSWLAAAGGAPRR